MASTTGRVKPGYFEYDDILGHDKIGDVVKYYVKWTGYDASQNTWVEQDDFQCPIESVEDYFTGGKVKIIQYVPAASAGTSPAANARKRHLRL